MANAEHLAILRQGVEVWNKWRKENPSVRPELDKTDLSVTSLSGANLIGAKLSGAILTGANLTEADLSGAYLSEATLSGTNLYKANLVGAKLSGANLTEADLREASLSQAYFNGAYLMGANLTQADLRGANFSEAHLNGACLIEANLTQADLNETDFSVADLSRASLSEAKLFRANFFSASLNKANLSKAQLVGTQALATNFTEANFTAACIEDWNINSATKLNGVTCDYVYKKRNEQERRPSSGNFAPGEFTKLFQKTLETVDLIFRNGINWDAFAYSFKKVEVENQGAQLDVQSIEKKGDGVLVVRVSVSLDANKAKIHGDFIQGYEFARKALEAQFQVRLEDKDKEINRLFYLLDKANEQLGEVPKLLAENPRKVFNYYQQNSQFAGGFINAQTVQSNQIGGDIYNTDNQERPS